MRLWVDYTNHRGSREWREIQTMTAPEMMEYPPKAETTRALPCVEVWMVDRQATRRLALTSIHGFAWQEYKPLLRMAGR